METHGNNPLKNVIAIIPARYASTRLPGKLLLEVAGKALILHTLEQAKKARNVDRVIVATDDRRIFDIVRAARGEATMTKAGHRSGSDRIAEVAESLPTGSIVVNVQGDEPMISPRTIEEAVDAFIDDETAEVATTSEAISDIDDLMNGNVVKVVTDQSGYALYFSRSPIPYPRESAIRNGGPDDALHNEPELLSLFRKHTGLYVYTREFLLRFAKMPQSKLEQIEMLEQLRALENGARIKVVEVAETSIGVDTPEDLERARSILERPEVIFREATVDDIPQVAKVHVESWRRSFPGVVPQEFLDSMSAEKREEAFRERFSDAAYKMLVAEDPVNGIVGFADFGTPRLEGVGNFETQIYAFYFLKEFQGKGLGGALFRRCIKEITDRGFTNVCLDSLAVSPYRKFYDKMGGKVVGGDGHKLAGVHFATVIYGWSNLGEI